MIGTATLIPSLPCSRDSPGIWFFVLVRERLDPLCLLELGQLGRVGELEEGGGILHQPLGVNGGDLSEVLLGGLHHLMEHNPLWLPG